MSNPDPATPVADYAWGLEAAWSTAADDLKRVLGRARLVSLLLLVLGAVLGAVGSLDAPDNFVKHLWPAGAALALATAGGIEALVITPERARDWAEARMASERLKAVLYPYHGRVTPYDGSEEDRSIRLRDAVDDIHERATHEVGLAIEPAVEPRDPVTSGQEITDYVQHRAEDQLEYHRRAGRREQRSGDILRTGVFVLTLAGALCGVLGALVAPVAGFVAAASSAAAAITTHAGAARHHEVARSYARTANRLELALQRFSSEPDQGAEFPAFVTKVEGILAIQNDLWTDVIER